MHIAKIIEDVCIKFCAIIHIFFFLRRKVYISNIVMHPFISNRMKLRVASMFL